MKKWIATTTTWSRNDVYITQNVITWSRNGESAFTHTSLRGGVSRRSNCKLSFPRRRESRTLLSQG
ncbi:hypothetical protein [Candidatus Tisiphia endosymbiont of Hybos culiciformis]|uniref:hypothetical protein n=1 Tax=Candidatus Tisiphia endosymbiont of Hybos culiciformis TaxID=3139331 RepID=UPI003CCB0248